MDELVHFSPFLVKYLQLHSFFHIRTVDSYTNLSTAFDQNQLQVSLVYDYTNNHQTKRFASKNASKHISGGFCTSRVSNTDTDLIQIRTIYPTKKPALRSTKIKV